MAKTKENLPPAPETTLDQPKKDESLSTKSGEIVTVALKHPNGIFMQLYDMAESPEVGPLGTRIVKIARKRGESIRLNGTAVPHGKTPRFTIAGGYALTGGVPKDFFDEWLHQNRESDLVKNRLIFCASSTASAMDEATEKEEIRGGLEPMDPDAPPREMQVQNKNVQFGSAS